MRTLILSDLHLGSRSHSDLLRRPEMRIALLEVAAEVDRVVLLGDVLELRHGPLRDAMEAARPFFEELGYALAGRELVLSLGNHDHALIEPWLARRGEEVQPPALEAQQLLDPAEVSPALERIAEWAGPAQVRVAYPGLWVRADVYASHGHYLDCHLTVPTLERLSVAVMSRLLGRPASSFDSVADYEAMGAPVFAWRDAVARDASTGAALNGVATVTAWRVLRGRRGEPGGRDRSGGESRRRQVVAGRLRRAVLIAAFRIVIAVLNRAGLGPLKADVSSEELRRGGLRAMGEVAARIGLGDAYVVFGHTHRAGPFPEDDQAEWIGRDGARLINSGSWTYASIFLTPTPGESPYWPGTCVLVEDSGPPVLKRLLHDRTHEQLLPQRSAGERP
jgi:predicted phosphodiesterase